MWHWSLCTASACFDLSRRESSGSPQEGVSANSQENSKTSSQVNSQVNSQGKLTSKLTSKLTGKGKGQNPVREKGKPGEAKREKGRGQTPAPQKSRKTRAYIQFPKP